MIRRQRDPGPRPRATGWLFPVTWLLFCGCVLPALAQDAPRPEKSAAPPIPIRFEGFVPGSVSRTLEGTFSIEFRLYRSPQGGEPIWRETHEVEAKQGRIDVRLGLEKPIPRDVIEATFKWIGASVAGQPEVYPRYHCVNVVFVSPEEATRAREAPPSKDDPGEPATRVNLTDIAAESEPATTWAEALRIAREKGGDLPEYEDWYRALETCSADSLANRVGHYEWVLPWAYDTASHGTYNRYFRGRFEGCDYMDLSPLATYVYRIARHSSEGGAATPAGHRELEPAEKKPAPTPPDRVKE